LTKSDKVFDIDVGHSAEKPKLRRLSSPVDQDPTYWEFASSSLMADIAEDLLGPNIKFHHSKLNFKWAEAGQEVKWHQDIQAWPHTDYSPLTMGIYLQDTNQDMGPLLCLPGSHEGELFDHFDENGKWIGHIRDKDLRLESRRDADGACGQHHYPQLPNRARIGAESLAARKTSPPTYILRR
jgi:ectoine hydroxylase